MVSLSLANAAPRKRGKNENEKDWNLKFLNFDKKKLNILENKMNVRVGPFYGGGDEEMLTIETHQARARKPSVELLESVRLRPTYYSFPQFNYDQSPNVPSFRFPQYSFYSLKEPSLLSPSSNSIVNRTSPKSIVGEKPEGKTTMFGTVVNCSNFFFGVSTLHTAFLHLTNTLLSDWDHCFAFWNEVVGMGGTSHIVTSGCSHTPHRFVAWKVPTTLFS